MLSHRFAPALLILLFLGGFTFLSIWLVRPPDALPSNALATDFSAGRALQHVRQIAREPHAMGTPGHARARAYLIDQLRQLGLQPQVQETTVASPNRGGFGYAYNILGRLKGQTAGKAVLLMAHYDSQPNTPGAADDGAGIAALLETARALRQGKPLRNDVIFLMTDGEEYGLYGIQAFLRHPWVRDIGFVVNLEARGNSGPSMTFEISPENGWVIDELAKAAPVPFASSLMYEVYRVLPNYTDFTVLREAGYAGVNSAFTDGFVHYHKLTDTPENLNRNSLQHHGVNMLALARHFGNLPLDRTKAPDKVFFNPAGSWLVHYPLSLNIVWLVLVTVLLVATLLAGARKKVLTIPQSVGSLFVFLLLLVLLSALTFPLNLLVVRFLPYTHLFNGVYNSALFCLAYSLIVFGLFIGLVRLALRWLRPFSLLMGVYGLLYILTVALYVRVPSSTFLFLFPLLFGLVGTMLIVRRPDLLPLRPGPVLILSVSALPAIFQLMPLVYLLSVIFALQLPMASAAILVLLLGLLLPVLLELDQRLRWRQVPLLPVFSIATGLLLTIWSIRDETPTAQRPLHSHVSYFLNTDTGRAYWASAFTTTDDWNRQFFPSPTTGTLTELYPIAAMTYLKNGATPMAIQPPEARLLSDSTTATERRLTIQLRSRRGAAHLEILLLAPAEADWRGATINGEPLTVSAIQTSAGAAFYTVFHGLPLSKTVTLTVRLKQGKPLRLLLYDQSIGLPGSLIRQPRPNYVIPEQGRTSNLTVVRKTYQF